MMCERLSLVSGQEPQWKVFGHLKEGRTHFGTALIGQGKVLVIGGFTQQKGLQSERLRGVVSSSCEIIDILAHQIIAAPSTIVPHSASVVLTMKDSNIVVVSGLTTDSTTTPICEMYDRKRNNWRVLGSLIWGRHAHSASFLNTEEIIVVGGRARYNYAAVIAEAEIFNIRTGKSRLVEDFPGKSTEGVALESRIFSPQNPLFLCGRTGGGHSHHIPNLYCFDTRTSHWICRAELPEALSATGVQKLSDGRYILVGGIKSDHSHFNKNLDLSPNIYIENPQGFSRIGMLSKPRFRCRVEQWSNDIILVMGGSDEKLVAQNSTEWFDLQSRQSIEGPLMNNERGQFSSVSFSTFNHQGQLLGTRILAIGGIDAQWHSLSSVEILETTNPQLLEIPNSEIASQRLKQILTSPIVIATLAIFIFVLIVVLLYLLYQVLVIRRQSKFSYQINVVEGQKR